jgi:hypothetical protein
MPAHSPIPTDGPRKRRRPITAQGALYRELGLSRLEAGKAIRLAQIPEDQFEPYLARPSRIAREISVNAILQHFGKLSPERPRPPECARNEAIQRLTAAREGLKQLDRMLREVGSDEESELLSSRRREVLRTLPVLTKWQKSCTEVEADDEDHKG